jgi:hypothetical protein
MSLRGDPLAAMFGLFARLADGEELPAVERLARPTLRSFLRARSYALAVTFSALAAVLIPCLLAMSSPPGCAHGAAARHTACRPLVRQARTVPAHYMR